MTAPRFARGTKSRIFLYIGLLVCLGIAVCIFHETQSRMDDVRKGAEKCQQQQESLAAQLQVIFEYKLRLEKSVQQEKADHRHTREELQTQLEEERARRAKEVLEATNKLASLQQHYKLLQGQHEDLADECSKARAMGVKAAEARAASESQLLQLQTAQDKDTELLKTQITQLRTENDRLMKQAQEAISQGQQAASLASSLRTQNQQFQAQLSQAKGQAGYSSKASAALAASHGHLQSPPQVVISSSSSSLAPPANIVRIDADNQSVLHMPNKPDKVSSSPTFPLHNKPSTNSGNKLLQAVDNHSQVAPVPAPGPPEQDSVGAKPSLAREGKIMIDDWKRLPIQQMPIPAGVVPAPNVFHDMNNYGGHIDEPAQHEYRRLHLSNLQNVAARLAAHKIAAGEESHQIAQPLPPGHLMPQQHLPLYQGIQQRREAEGEVEAEPGEGEGEGEVEEEGKAVGVAPPGQGGKPMWKAEEEEEGGNNLRMARLGPGQGVYRHYQPQDSYKEEEGELDDRDRERGVVMAAAGGGAEARWPAENQIGEHAPGEAHDELQLEDVEEDDDDDVDQIDYGNDVPNNGVAKHKQQRKAQIVDKHESVMVNPK